MFRGVSFLDSAAFVHMLTTVDELNVCVWDTRDISKPIITHNRMDFIPRQTP